MKNPVRFTVALGDGVGVGVVGAAGVAMGVATGDGDCVALVVGVGVGVGVEVEVCVGDGVTEFDGVGEEIGEAIAALIFLPRFQVRRPLFRIQLYA